MGNYSNEAYRESRDLLIDELTESVATEAAKEVDEERRGIAEVSEKMRMRQRYFYEKAQMHDEAASFYRGMSEDIATYLNNEYLDGPKNETAR